MKDKTLIIILTLLLIIIIIPSLIFSINNYNEIEQRCKDKGWDGVRMEDLRLICFNYSQGRLDAMEEKN